MIHPTGMEPGDLEPETRIRLVTHWSKEHTAERFVYRALLTPNRTESK